MYRCKYDSKITGLRNELKYDTKNLGHYIALHSPKNSQYNIKELKCDIKNKYTDNKFTHEIHTISYPSISHNCYSKINKNGARIVILHIVNNIKSKNTFTMLVSHGHTSTIGTIYPTLLDFAYQFRCDVLAYDYTGYGHSDGEASINELHIDIEHVAKFANYVLKIQTQDLILFGCNIGSIPTMHLATQSEYSNIKGIILISPVSTGVRIIYSDLNIKQLKKMKNYDIYHNVRGISNIKSNVLLIHGMKDDIIPFESSKELSKHILNINEWFPKKGDNGNILTIYRTKFIIRCKSFFEYLNYRKSRSSGKYSDSNDDYINSCIENGYIGLDKILSSPVYNSFKFGSHRNQSHNTHSMIAFSCPFDSKDSFVNKANDSEVNGI